LEAFTYSVSHDLRAPVRAIDGFSQILQERYSTTLDETGAHYLTRIRAGTQRMNQLINALLNLSRVNRQELSLKRVNLSQIANRIVDELRQFEPGRAITVQIAQNLVVEGDAPLLRLVMQNLLDNAWKFTRNTENPWIRLVQKRLDDGREAFGVLDNGAGFNMAHADRLFGVFQRLHSAEEYPGTGVGLATVQRIIHRHGGEIWAEGEPNRGADFWFSLESKG
jgi:light-regulated signal transduction histidine kinase (bacteriophytochrome)